MWIQRAIGLDPRPRHRRVPVPLVDHDDGPGADPRRPLHVLAHVRRPARVAEVHDEPAVAFDVAEILSASRRAHRLIGRVANIAERATDGDQA